MSSDPYLLPYKKQLKMDHSKGYKLEIRRRVRSGDLCTALGLQSKYCIIYIYIKVGKRQDLKCSHYTKK